MHLRRFKLTVLNYYCPENDGGMKLVGEHAEGRRHICWKEEAISASRFLHVAQDGEAVWGELSQTLRPQAG